MSEPPWLIGKGERLGAWCFEGCLVVVALDTGVLRLYNSTALAVWLLLADELTKESLIQELVAIFEADPLDVRYGILPLLSEWCELGWVDKKSDVYGLTYQTQSLDKQIRDPKASASPRDPLIGSDIRAEYRIMLAAPVDVHIHAEEGCQPKAIFQRLCAILAGFPIVSFNELPSRNALTIDIYQQTVCLSEQYASTHIEADATEVVSQTLLHLLKLGYPENRTLATIHAAGLSHRDTNQGVLLPGISGAGKSTLAVALADRGWGYLGDDIVGLNDSHGIMPLPTAASIKPNSWNVLADHSESLDRLRLISYSGKSAKYLPVKSVPTVISPVPLRRWVFPKFEKGVGLSLRRMSPLEVLQSLIEAGMGLSDALTVNDVGGLLRMLYETPAHRVIYCDIEEVAQWLVSA